MVGARRHLWKSSSPEQGAQDHVQFLSISDDGGDGEFTICWRV